MLHWVQGMQPKTDLEQPLAGAKATRAFWPRTAWRRKGFAGTTANQREMANLETSLQLKGIMHHPSAVLCSMMSAQSFADRSTFCAYGSARRKRTGPFASHCLCLRDSLPPHSRARPLFLGGFSTSQGMPCWLPRQRP